MNPLKHDIKKGYEKAVEESELFMAEVFRMGHEINYPSLDISKLTKADVGRVVGYIGFHSKSFEFPLCEMGIISSWNDKTVFVKFKKGWMTQLQTLEVHTSQGCNPRDLHFSTDSLF